MRALSLAAIRTPGSASSEDEIASDIVVDWRDEHGVQVIIFA